MGMRTEATQEMFAKQVIEFGKRRGVAKTAPQLSI
jgi:hypothetical protein